MKQHKKLLMDLVFAAVILAAAAVLLLVRKANQTGAPLCAELIYGDSNTRLTFPLEKDADYAVDIESQVDYGKSRNMAMTSVIFVVGLSGITVQFGSIQLSGMVLACVIGMLMGLMFYVLDKLKLTNDRESE